MSRPGWGGWGQFVHRRSRDDRPERQDRGEQEKDRCPVNIGPCKRACHGRHALVLRAQQDSVAMKVLSRGPGRDTQRPQPEARSKSPQPAAQMERTRNLGSGFAWTCCVPLFRRAPSGPNRPGIAVTSRRALERALRASRRPPERSARPRQNALARTCAEPEGHPPGLSPDGDESPPEPCWRRQSPPGP